MNWLNGQEIKWEAPLLFATRFDGYDVALLYSGLRDQASGDTSYMAVDALETCETKDWDELANILRCDQPTALPDWIGYLGYGMRETRARKPSYLHFPDCRFVRYAHLYRFDHRTNEIRYFHRPHVCPLTLPAARPRTEPTPSIETLSADSTRNDYQTVVEATLAGIHEGDFYQANITRKFMGTFIKTPDSLAVFNALATANPTAYSGYIRHGNTAILSASPESFLELNATGEIVTRPIKGSARRVGDDEKKDTHVRESLIASSKNQAENLMITDLMRNDLARVSMPQSVTVTESAALHSYATIHHLISTIRAQKREEVSTVDLIRACFPPGSMTGAPKRAAMGWCAAREPMERGVYSGAIGWINSNACALSVVIRTLLIAGTAFEFQVGGGIVADSQVSDEWLETMTKARGICAALGIEELELHRL